MSVFDGPDAELELDFIRILENIGAGLGAMQTDLNLLSTKITPGRGDPQLQVDVRLVKETLILARSVTRNLKGRREEPAPKSTPRTFKKGELQ